MNIFVYELVGPPTPEFLGLFANDRMKADRTFGKFTGLTPRFGYPGQFVNHQNVVHGKFRGQLPCYPENAVVITTWDNQVRVNLRLYYDQRPGTEEAGDAPV